MNRADASQVGVWVLGCLCVFGTASRSVGEEVRSNPVPGSSALPAAREAIRPAAPEIPPAIVGAMQEGRYDEARQALNRLAGPTKDADDRAYLTYLRAVVERLAGDGAAAREALDEARKASPGGRWTARIDYEEAALNLAAGRLDAAEEQARKVAGRLLASDRKDRLAEVYRGFALKLLEPGDPVIPADPAAARELLDQARDLARSPDLRARLRETMSRASLASGAPLQAVQDCRAYLNDFPNGPDRFVVEARLGEALRAAGRPDEARRTWTDLVAEIQSRKPADQTPPLVTIRATALYEIATTFGIPTPNDDGNLALGVAALKRFLEAAPTHPKAVRACYSIGAAYLHRGKATEAYNAFERFLREEGFRIETDEARRDWSELSMDASFQVARILQGQQRFVAAIAAWRGYLTRFPNGPQGADAQRAILDTELMIAADHLTRHHYVEARASWSEFIARNPLDDRVPGLLFEVGRSYRQEDQFDRAIAAWETLAAKFPRSEPAAHGQFEAASILETEKGDPTEAIERFRKIEVEPWRTQARQHVAVMESKHLLVVTPRAFRSGEPAHLAITTRNIETLKFDAYRLDPEAYFRAKESLSQVEALDIGLVAPDASWTSPVADYAKYRPTEAKYELKPLKLPGVYAVKVTDEKTLQATTLVVGSDVDAIVKTSREQVLVFAQDMKTGRGRAGARVLIADGSQVFLEAKTGDDGVLLHTWNPTRAPGQGLSYLVIDGPDVAGSGLAVPGMLAEGISPRAYIETDRPAYRPGQKVSIRGVIREVENGHYAVIPKAAYRLEVLDSRGRALVERPVKLSEFGTFHDSLPLDPGAPVGDYRIVVSEPGKNTFHGNFQVQAYQLRPIGMSIELEKAVVNRGEEVRAEIVARYRFGGPIAGHPISVRLPDDRTLHGTTDAAGKFHVAFSTKEFAEYQVLLIEAILPQDGDREVAYVKVAARGFEIDVRTGRDVYLDGESFAAEIETTDPLGKPVGESLSATLVKRVKIEGRITEREVARKSVKTDTKTGRGSVTFRADDAQGGSYLVRVAGKDRFETPIIADRALMISGQQDETKLRLLTDRVRYKVGEEASIHLHSRGRSGPALLAWEADRILAYRIVELKEGDNAIAWAVDNGQFPNFTLTAARMWRSDFDQARLDLQVERDLRVSLKPSRPVVGPGEPIELDVTTVDQLGRPVAAELSIAMIDQSLLHLFQDRLPEIGAFFHNQSRTGSFATRSTNTFRYQPGTIPVPQAIVEDAEQSAAMDANAVERKTANAVEEERLLREAQQLEAAGRNALGVPMPSQQPNGAYAFGGFNASQGQGRMGGMMAGVANGQVAKAPSPVEAQSMPRMARPMTANEPGSAVREWRDKAERSELALSDSNRAPLAKRRGKDADLRGEPTRERFVESAYWNPAVVTGPDGKARVTFKAPLALSEYRITARGVTGSETLAGQTTAELAVRKDFFVDLKVPASLTQGDKPRFSAEVHHRGVRGTLNLKLATYAGGRDDVFPKKLELAGDGVEEVAFEPYEVPEGDSLRLTLTATVGQSRDEMVVEVPIRPWGVPAFASASGTSGDSTTVFVGFPPGRTYENPELRIAIAPTVRRMLVELALGSPIGVQPLASDLDSLSRWLAPPTSTTADRASELLAAASVLSYLRDVQAGEAPEAVRLVDRIRSLVSELSASQTPDGAWPWISAGLIPEANGKRPIPDHDWRTSAAVVWAMAEAERLGLLSDPKVLDQAVRYLKQQFTQLRPADHEARAAILHALSARHAASFEAANALNRIRNQLSDAGLAYLAMTFANLDRPTLAAEILGILGPRAKTESARPGRPDRMYWDRAGRQDFVRSAAEITAMVAIAYARTSPDAPERKRAVAWIEAHRVGDGWLPYKATGPALAALSLDQGRARAAEDRYQLTVTVNDAKVATIDVQWPTAGKTFAVPRAAVKAGEPNRIRFEMEGRGTFGYSAVLSGFTRDFAPDQTRGNRVALVDRRVYLKTAPELDGRTLATGFSVAVESAQFENRATQVGPGGRVRVELDIVRGGKNGEADWDREFLIVQDQLPAGTTIVEGSLRSRASSYEMVDGVLTLYFPPDSGPWETSYEILGSIPGEYRVPPAMVRSAYEPGRYHLGRPETFRVRRPNEPDTDPYRPTPDELFARGKAHFEAGRFEKAGEALEPLFGGYTLRDAIAREAARMLLLISIGEGRARSIVQYFEVVKEKSPDLFLSFDQLTAIGAAYRDIKEYERAMIVWRGLVEASYLEDARVGELLRQRGRRLEGLAYLIDLWRSYPQTPAIDADFFGLSQLYVQESGQAFTDPALRRELASAGITRSQMLLQAIRMMWTFLAGSPRSPMADEASLSIVGGFIELEDFESVVRLADRFARIYPRSPYLDSFLYSEALGDFHLGRYDRAVEVASQIAKAVYKDAAGAEQPSPNKWQAIYILGQIFDARRQPARALEYYRQVAGRFTDAADAVRSYTRKELKLAEITVIRPPQRPAVAAGAPGGFRAIEAVDPAEPPGVTIEYRNIAKVDVKVYPVDLMPLYLARRNLNTIAGIDLAGITPMVDRTVVLGSGADYDDRKKRIELPFDRDGAYLVMIRGEGLHASGIVLVSPMEMEAIEEDMGPVTIGPNSVTAMLGRVRVTVRDARTGDLLPKVEVKVIGSLDHRFVTGRTDLRGVFVAEGVNGEITALAKAGANRFAFYRGRRFIRGNLPAGVGGSGLPGGRSGLTKTPEPGLDAQLRMQNSANALKQVERLQQRFGQPSGNRKGASAGDFR